MTINPVVFFVVSGLVLAVLLVLVVMLARSGPAGVGGSAVNISALVTWLQGKKSTIGIVLIALNNYAARRGWIDPQLCNDLNYVLGTGTALAFVQKTNRVEQKQDVVVEQAKVAADAATDTNAIAVQTQQAVKTVLKLPVTPLSVPSPKPAPTPGSIL